MDDDQQFCLRWNNHQSTLVAVFDTLLENGTLVDCTLAAEGKCLNAHKVVLSACSPYFEALLSKHFDKHPILILKDVKFQELKAMMDYMYRGEVNISQDQLGALLKAAESLQIKGLSDNRKGETSDRKPTPAAPPPKSPQPASTLPKVQGLTIEQRAREDSREGSMSPGPRKKKRLRRKSEELDNHDASNSSESHSLPAQSIPMLPAITKMNADVPDQVETKSEILTRHKQIEDTIPQVPIIKEKIETHTELMLEPKSEYVDEMNEDSIEDLTLDDDDLSNMEQVDDQAGPSHGAGEGSSQGFGGWHMGNQSQDEVFLAAQEAVGAHRDSQGKTKRVDNAKWPSHLVLPMMILKENLALGVKEPKLEPPESHYASFIDEKCYACSECGKTYKVKSSLTNHKKWECGKEPRFKCPYCDYKAKQKVHLTRHLRKLHKIFSIDSELNQKILNVSNDGVDIGDVDGVSKTETSNQ
ncbi:longitudinals lacking protein, isoforms A/B/D/L isoform X8 [Diorhabda carinulata]|uniref:longitudinals lacking protein, isoforms A/B/D/L-like isoform X8 n=1 Tax=Diorhabda sublineata TaxID=1163346 RepID=UPI0024E1396B|nr:longitudinals lacking protein, isoforms A/B/D/L-like isoform X8 [Diorhabda sublineata]XP_057672593.1 longitudinals lacking protein, isoforms A/B/D/L isoform X8 [Diorhabda carinulata]